MANKPVIGVSACLRGENVRFDGGHKRQTYITDTLAAHAEIRTVCPEMGMGLGTPRPALRLQVFGRKTRLVVSQDPEQDLTVRMQRYAGSALDQFSDLDGFIFKKGSPSCGAWRVPVMTGNSGQRRYDGTGLFAKAFMERYPWVPVEEEGRLNDPALRENFFERVYALRRWHDINDPDTNLNGLIEFHASHKLMLMAHSQAGCVILGQWVANTGHENLKARRHDYLRRFMEVMQNPVSKGRHINILMHIMGYLKKRLSASDKKELLEHFEAYRQNHLPLVSLILLLQHHMRGHPVPYLERQHYLTPYPPEVALRTAV